MQAAAYSVRNFVFPALALLASLGFEFGELWLARLPPEFAYAPPVAATVLLIGAVFAALAHAETVGARLGEPFGTLVLTISVTIIEVAIMGSMIKHGGGDLTEAREMVFSAIMIVCNGLVGGCLLLGGMRHLEQELHPMGARAYLAVLIAVSVLLLILPNYTSATVGPTLSPLQLAFFSIQSVLLYGVFLFIQTVRHRSYFLDVNSAVRGHREERPTNARAGISTVLLLASLLGVGILAQEVVPSLTEALEALGAPDVNKITGAAVAMLVLLPESVNSLRAASRNALQTALNSALGSVVATIGLTVPAVAAVSLFVGQNPVLGLEPRETVMLVLTFALSVVSFGGGRTNVLTGMVHLVVFTTYVFLLIVP